MCKAANADPNHPKIGWKGKGNDWNPGDIDASNTDYRGVILHPGDVVYADIPYEGTDQAGYGKGKFNKEAFVHWAQTQDVPIYVSEYTMPEGWVEVESYDVPGMKGGRRTERLWVQDRFAESMVRDDATEEEKSESQTRFSIVKDPKEIERLEKEPTVTRYRAMVEIDGKLYPPMSVMVDGELREPTEEGVWERSDETPIEITEEQQAAMDALDAKEGSGTVTLIPGKLRYRKDSNTGKGTIQFHLKKDEGTPVWAAYNPYFHTSTSGMNDQFASAWKRPNLVVAEVSIPESELTDGYQAPYAKNAVGNTPWKSGIVNNALPEDRQRTVTLSRYAKVEGKVDDAKVAKMIAKLLEGLDIEVPFNVVTPSLRDELVKQGVKIGAPEKGNAGKAAIPAYEEWLKSQGEKKEQPRFSLPGDDARSNETSQEEKLVERKKSLLSKAKGWLTNENIDWAEGKDLQEIIQRFGNDPEPIAILPAIVRKNIPSLGDDYLYCGKAYFIDHQANHHPELELDEYDNIQTILDSYDDIKD